MKVVRQFCEQPQLQRGLHSSLGAVEATLASTAYPRDHRVTIIGTHPPSQFPIQGDSQLRNLTPLFFNENYRHRVFFAAGLSVVNAGSSLAVLDI